MRNLPRSLTRRHFLAGSAAAVLAVLLGQGGEVLALARARREVFGAFARSGLVGFACALLRFDQDMPRVHLLLEPGVAVLLALVFGVDVFLILGDEGVELGRARREFARVEHR